MAYSKYRSKKVIWNGNTYDSQKEARRHAELLLLQRAGAISGLQRQIKFELIPAQRDQETGKVIERAVTYVADFVYTQNGRQIVEDVKGYKGGSAYAIFTIKRKLMLYVHHLKIKEV